MTHSRLQQVAPALALVAGLAFAVEGAIVFRSPQGDDHWALSGYIVEAAFVVGLAAVIAVLPVIPRAASKLTMVVLGICEIGFAGMLASSVPSLLMGRTVLGFAFFIGVLAALAALLLMSGVAVLQRWTGWWLWPVAFAGLVLSMFLGDFGGGVLLGVAWAGIGIALVRTGKVVVATA